MLKVENVEVLGWEHAIRGMRNPKNSWEKSDSNWRYVAPAQRENHILASYSDDSEFKHDLINKYGEPDKDESGNETGTISIKVGSPNFKAFCDELAPFNEMEHEVELMTAKYEDTIGCLSGEEILLLDWMLED